ncbi:SusD/RagB family nutrient-binding outer membrane lipoprotein [Draconibacterium sp.]|nr:SusD/RagB family nutrient-binding outer membrane lipoprotein [Draconibacterium sp.]
MKKIIYLLLGISILTSCTDDFAEINTNPGIGVPPAEFLFTYVEKEMVTYKGGGAWYHKDHQSMSWGQYLVQGEANSGDINTILPGSKYGTFYGKVLGHLDEMRRQIGFLSEEEQLSKSKLIAAADVLQAFFALKVTDQFGDIPYSEAGLGRHEGKLDPVFDKQEDILLTLVDELNGAIQALNVNLTDEFNMSDVDFVYKGDASKWIKLANAVKLRIATRLESQNLTKAKEIISSVVADGRLFEGQDDEFTLDIGYDYRGSSSAGFEWKGLMWAPKPMVDFMKKTVDPRIRIFYEPNGYTQETFDAIESAGETISPAVDTLNDNKILYTTTEGEDIYGYRYIGAPTHRQDPTVGIPGYWMYIDDPNTVGGNTMMVSKWNRRLIQTCNHDYGGLPPATGNYVDVQLSHAEVCFMMAEFILKGYTSGDEEDWYNKGIASSIRTYNMIGTKGDLTLRVAGKTYPYMPISEDEIASYLADPAVVFDGSNDLEKVYVQQFINFYRLPEEGWKMSMRTGFPKYGSSLLARFPTDNNEIPFPRRAPTPEPGDLNLANWEAANADQGFTNPRDETPAVLNSQRLWWDKNNPAIGSGGN